MNPPPLTQADLIPARCGLCPPGVGECNDPLVLRARCHPTAGLRVQYEKLTGVVDVRCARCELGVARFAVRES